jgi:hypothetical protein
MMRVNRQTRVAKILQRRSKGGCVTHSITSSALTNSDGGMSRPSAFAVVKLITSSNLLGCCTGRLEGWAPLRMRSTYEAPRRNKSPESTP